MLKILKFCRQLFQYSQQIEATKPGAAGANEGVLANFFNALLSKKTGTTPSPGAIKTNGKYSRFFALSFKFP